MVDLNEIQTKVELLAKLIDSPVDQLPTYGNSRGDGTPNIDIGGGTYYYTAPDRGVMSINRQTQNIDELLYWIFKDITFSMAVWFELENRIKDQHARRLIFSHQLGLLKTLDTNWFWKAKMEIAKILQNCPYDDSSGVSLQKYEKY
jgi:hypothetical protein